ncbi:MAG: histidine phosphatase family protein [Sediminibacterium sp.]
MKQLLIIRHAKSSWALVGQDDFDRPLNDRGMKDAPMMAQRLIEKSITIDAFISSPAKRALTTANFFVDAYNAKGALQTIQKLYHAHSTIFFEVIAGIDDSIHTAAIFSHNPGITSFINELTKTKIDNMPTCGVFGIQAEIDHWKDFWPAKKSFWFFDYPKQ